MQSLSPTQGGCLPVQVPNMHTSSLAQQVLAQGTPPFLHNPESERRGQSPEPASPGRGAVSATGWQEPAEHWYPGGQSPGPLHSWGIMVPPSQPDSNTTADIPNHFKTNAKFSLIRHPPSTPSVCRRHATQRQRDHWLAGPLGRWDRWASGPSLHWRTARLVCMVNRGN